MQDSCALQPGCVEVCQHLGRNSRDERLQFGLTQLGQGPRQTSIAHFIGLRKAYVHHSPVFDNGLGPGATAASICSRPWAMQDHPSGTTGQLLHASRYSGMSNEL